MFDAITKAAAWDPMGVAADEPSSFADRLKQELKLLRAGVRSVVEGAQGIPTTRSDDAASLVACLKEVMQEQRDEADANQREVKNLQKAIAMLQEDRRRREAQPLPLQPRLGHGRAVVVDERRVLDRVRLALTTRGRANTR